MNGIIKSQALRAMSVMEVLGIYGNMATLGHSLSVRKAVTHPPSCLNITIVAFFGYRKKRGWFKLEIVCVVRKRRGGG